MQQVVEHLAGVPSMNAKAVAAAFTACMVQQRQHDNQLHEAQRQATSQQHAEDEASGTDDVGVQHATPTHCQDLPLDVVEAQLMYQPALHADGLPTFVDVSGAWRLLQRLLAQGGGHASAAELPEVV